MAKINYDYSEETVLYDSGDIEEILLKRYKEGNPPSELEQEYFYPLTPIRENIINWYPFKKNCTILEVGGGLGSITGALCQKAKKVVSCEYSKRRAENIYYRHKDKENLEVIVGDLNKVEFKEKFDYIVLIGVFEYAKRFTKTQKPFFDFLNNLKRHLKKDGVLLIAVENRFGIKYWAGDYEDHYPEKYIGLTGYNNACDIKTMGKLDLISIFEESNMKYKFYYPYPDYKMPYVITTDEREFNNTEISSLKIYNHGEQIHNFDYRKVLPGIIKNKQYGFFANSFLVELSTEISNFSDVIYVKTHWNRTNKYQINTIIKKDKLILKVPKYPEGMQHLDNLVNNHKKFNELGIKTSNIKKNKEEYQIEYIDGELLSEYIYNLVCEKNKELIIQEIDKYYNFLKSMSYKGKIKKFVSAEEKKYYVNEDIYILKIGTFDLQFSNIIKKEDLYIIIDQEWVSSNDIPLKYMLYFSIYYLFEWIEKIKDLIEMSELLKRYNISTDEVKIFHDMSICLSREFNNNNEKLASITESSNYVNIIDQNEQVNRVNQLNQELNDCKKLITEQELNYQNLLTEQDKIINSKRWKAINKLITIKEKIYKK